MHARRLLSAAWLVFLAAPLWAQPQLPKFGNWWPSYQFFGGTEMGTELADMNGDGCLDIMQPGVLATQPILNINRGNCRFEYRLGTGWPYQLFAVASRYVATGDVDGDGDIDVVSPSDLGQLGSPDKALYLNDGQGNLRYDTTGRLPTTHFNGMSAVLHDLDGDRDLDLIALNWDAQAMNRLAPLQILVNDGTGRFADESSTRFPRLPALWIDAAVLDVNRDGYPDIAAGGYGNVLEIWMNNGTGRFTLGQVLPYGVDGLKAADLDGDGWIDLLSGGSNRLYMNRNGIMVDESYRLPANSTFYRAAPVDLDQDGMLDLVLSSGVLRNSGGAVFTNVTALVTYNTPWPAGSYCSTADMDGDGDVDVVWNRPQQCGVMLNLRSHIQAPASALRGQVFGADLFGRPNELMLPCVGVKLGRFEVPGLGLWRLDPTAMAPLPTIGLTGFPSLLSLPIPNDPALANLTFYLQAVHLQQEPGGVRYRTSHWREITIQ